MLFRIGLVGIAVTLLAINKAGAQQGYEFEVYGAETGRVGPSELELQVNYVPDGIRIGDGESLPGHRSFRSSIEYTHNLRTWLAGSAYVTAFAGQGRDLSYVGNRFRLTAIAPEKWSLPFALGVANEVIYARAPYSENRWAYELTPIIAKDFGSFSVRLNPAFERGIGANSESEIEFEPRGQVAYRLGDEAKFALEYYAGLGGISEGYPLREQRHQLFGRVTGEIGRGLELGFGAGRGLTAASDRWVIATSIEYEFPN